MTIASEKTKAGPWATDGRQTAWPFDFLVLQASDLKLAVVDADGTETIVDSAQFTVSGIGDPNGGTVTYPTSGRPLAAGGTVTVYRAPTFLQPTDLKRQGRYDPESVERQLDRDVMYAQRLKEQLARALKLRESDTDTDTTVPSWDAGKLLGWHKTAKKLALVDPPEAYGVTPGLTFDGSDQSAALQALIDSAIAAGVTYLPIVGPDGGTLGLKTTIGIYNPNPRPFVLDLRRVGRIKRLAYDARIRAIGKLSEWPTSNLPRLARSAAQNATSITITTAEIGGDLSRFVTGARIIIRGEQDASGLPLENPQQRHETTLTANATDNGDGTATLTLADPLPAAFEPSYPTSAWATSSRNSSGKDETLITVVDEWRLSRDAAKGDRVLNVASDPTGSLAVGDWVLVQDDRTAGDVQGTSSSPIRLEVHRVEAVTSTTVTLDVGLARDLVTAKAARVTRLLPCYQTTILCPPADEFVQAPAAAPAPRIPAWEAKYAIEPTIVAPRLDDTATTYTTRGQLVRLENCYRPRVVDPVRIGKFDTSDATSGDRYGLYLVGCRDAVVTGGHFVRCRHGVVVGASCTNVLVMGVTTDDCLINGLDTHGAHNIGVVFAACVATAGPSRPPDATNQSGVTVGNTTHQAGDYDVLIVGNRFTGFTDTDGAIEIRTPSGDVFVSGCHVQDGVDAVVLKETGTIDGGAVFVDGIAMENCPGYAVDDDTTSTKFARVVIGTTLADGNEAGVHSVGASGAAVRPDLVPDKGAVVGQMTDVVTTPYDIAVSDRYLSKDGASYDLRVHELRAAAGDTTAQTLNLPADAQPPAEIVIVVPDTKTADVTVGLQTGASFQDGGSSWKAAAPFGNGVERRLVFRCASNADGRHAVWVADGDLEPSAGYYSLGYPLVGAFGRAGVTSFSTNYTLATSDAGTLLNFTGGVASQLTLPASWPVREVIPGINSGTASLTIAGTTSGSTTIASGEGFTLIWNGSAWLVFPAGSFTVMT